MRNRLSAAIGIALIILGTLFALDQAQVLQVDWGTMWPVLILVAGILCHIAFALGGMREPSLLYPGGMCLMYGAAFLICTIYGWAYFWEVCSFFLLGPALSCLEVYMFGGQDREMLIPAVALGLIGFAILLYTVFDISLSKIVMPMIILAGIAVMVFSLMRRNLH